jgi:hypothetical protein
MAEKRRDNQRPVRMETAAVECESDSSHLDGPGLSLLAGAGYLREYYPPQRLTVVKLLEI